MGQKASLKLNEYRWLGLAFVCLVAASLLLVFLRTELQMSGGRLGAPLDDAWIHVQFARNLRGGFGFSFNPGEPTAGSTAPLWTLLLAVASPISDDYLLPAILLSALFMLGCVALSYAFALWVTESTWAAVLAGLGVAISGRFLWAGLAGMETTAFATISLAAIWVYSKRGWGWFPVLLMALAGQMRPEGHALFGLALIDSVVQWLSTRRRGSSSPVRALLTELIGYFLPSLLLYLLISAPYSLFSLVTSGRPLPNTFYAKVGTTTFFSIRTLSETIAWHWRDNPVGLMLLLAGLWPLWQRSRLAVLWLLALPVLTALIIDFTWHHGRYTMPLIPLQMVAAATGAHWLVREVGQRVKLKMRRQVTIGSILLLILLFLISGSLTLPAWANMLANNTREVLDIDVALGEWLAENTEDDALIAVDDIGAIAVLSGRRIVDMNGLVSPEVWPALNAAEGLPRNQVMTRILSDLAPDYMVAFPLWRWELATNTKVAWPIHQVQTATHTIIFQPDAFVYETTWPYIADALPQYTQGALFGENFRLRGFDVNPENETGNLILYWEKLAPDMGDFDLFVHLVDSEGEIIAQQDGKPLDGLTATNVWQPGDLVRLPIMIPRRNELPAGNYRLQIGLYQRESGQRLEISHAESSNNALTLYEFSVADPS